MFLRMKTAKSYVPTRTREKVIAVNLLFAVSS